ncbi:MAG: YfhO family protein [Candidatus Hydrogenedentes bacterium]|nr:YfhO family protein [Candidatus Hydrogenedentota bacterium]
MRRRVLRPYLLQAVVLAAALVPFFPGVFFRGEVLVPMTQMYDGPPWAAYRPSDLPEQNPAGTEITLQVCVWYRVSDMLFARGELPLWNPYQFTGTPMVANFQSSIFYPPRLLFRVLGDTYVAMTVFILLRLWFCGFNAFVAARILGLRSPFANLYSLLFMTVGYNQVWTFYPPPDVMAWLPLILAGAESVLRGRYRFGAAVLIATVPMAVLAAHPSTLILGCIGIALYALVRLAAARGPARHVLMCGASAGAAFAISLAVCAIQVLPFIEYLPETARVIIPINDEGASFYRYSVYDYLCLFAARLRGTEMDASFWGKTNFSYTGMLYMGMTTWVCLSLVTSRPFVDRPRRFQIGGMIAVSAVCLYLASGFPVANWIQQLPLISSSRPAYFIAFPSIALPLCAAYALQAWVDSRPTIRQLVRPLLTMAVVAGVVGAWVVSAQSLSSGYIELAFKHDDLGAFVAAQCGNAAAFAIVGCSVLLLCARYPHRARATAAALCILAVVDPAVTMWRLMATTPRQYVVPRTAITDYLLAQPQPYRARFDIARVRYGYPPLYGIEEFAGYDAIYPMRFKQFFEGVDLMPGSTSDRLLSCDFTLFLEGTPLPASYKPILQADGLIMAKRDGFLPRARLVGSATSFPSMDAMFAAVKRPDFDPVASVYTDVPLDFSLPPPDAEPAGTATIEEWRALTVKVRAHAAKECVLVLADAYAPGWEAAIDGVPARIFPAYHLYRGVYLPPGEHMVEFVYRPKSFRLGAAVSVVALSALAVYGVIRLRKGRGAIEHATL